MQTKVYYPVKGNHYNGETAATTQEVIRPKAATNSLRPQSSKGTAVSVIRSNPDLYPNCPESVFSIGSGLDVRSKGPLARELTKLLNDGTVNSSVMLNSSKSPRTLGKETANIINQGIKAILKPDTEIKKLIGQKKGELLKDQNGKRLFYNGRSIYLHGKVLERHAKEAMKHELIGRTKFVANNGEAMYDLTRDSYKIKTTENKAYNKIVRNLPVENTLEHRFFPLVRTVVMAEKEGSLDHLKSADIPVPLTPKSVLAREIRNLRKPHQKLALNPQIIARQLNNDSDFKTAYRSFIDALVKMGNGRLSVQDLDKLKSDNTSYKEGSGGTSQKKANWAGDKENGIEKIIYSNALDSLKKITNGNISVINNKAHEGVLDEILKEMDVNPQKPVIWTINGNNHFHTHRHLPKVLKQVAQKRKALNENGKRSVRDYVIISGNASGKAPYNAGPVGKFTSGVDGKAIGNQTEAAAIKSLLEIDADIKEGFNIFEESDSKNTGENIKNTIKILEEKGINLNDSICVNTQSGFSGLRSALTQVGWQAGETIPKTLYFINPDLSEDDATDNLSMAVTGQGFIQALREFMNFTAYTYQELFIPPVGVDAKIIENFKICLRKIGIDPDTSAAFDVQAILNEMNNIAMVANEGKLVQDGETYDDMTSRYLEQSKALRKKAEEGTRTRPQSADVRIKQGRASAQHARPGSAVNERAATGANRLNRPFDSRPAWK